MYRLFSFVFVFFSWIALNESVRPIILCSAFLLATLVFFISPLNGTTRKEQTAFSLLSFFAYLIFSIYKSSFIVIKNIVTNNIKVYSFALSTTLSHPIERTLLANSITLTPGTVTVDLSAEHLFVLSLSPDAGTVKNHGKSISEGFEKLLKK